MKKLFIQKKYTYLESLRIIAIFFVIFNHTGNKGYFLFSERPVGSAQFWIYLFISIFCKFAVPVFFAISGALMLGKEDEPLKVLWSKRILKIFILLILYSFIYYLNKIYRGNSTFSLHELTKMMYTTYVRGHLWYLYAYIAFLISLPFLKSMVRSLETKYYYYMIAIAVILKGIIPVVEYLLWQGDITLYSKIKVSWLMENIVLYPCIGYFMHHKIDAKKTKAMIPVLWMLNVAGILISSYMTYYKGQVTGVLSESKSQSFHNSFAVLNCMAIFLTFKYVFEKYRIPSLMEQIILSIGKCTFGIYLIHNLIKDRKVIQDFRIMLISMGMNYMVAVFIQCLLVLFISYVVTYILLKIPILKKLVGG